MAEMGLGGEEEGEGEVGGAGRAFDDGFRIVDVFLDCAHYFGGLAEFVSGPEGREMRERWWRDRVLWWRQA